MTAPVTTRQFWIRHPGHAEVVSREIARPAPGEVLVETLYSGVSRGTESLIYRGRVPPSQYEAMRAPFQDGEFPGPVKYGYSSVGRVTEAGNDASDLLDQTVFCLFPHQDRYVIPATAVVRVPAGVPAERAVLAANMETAVNVAWDARFSVGDRVVVVGAGVVGLLVAWLASRTAGTDTLLVDIDPGRSAIADRLGIAFDAVVPTTPTADVVIHASGTPAGLVSALDAAGPEATVVEASWHGDRAVELPLGEAFHSGRLTLRSSQVGRIPSDRSPRWTHARRLRKALELLTDPALDALITSESSLEELPAVMRAISGGEKSALCHRVRYSTGSPLRER